ncbi:MULTISPECIES: response regulator transcription factor [unclassified Virgibacillus]|uniref:response regulator transcription factor n=1 Tax=unclassified Virgibacillus TaxID=2620237 RepID=UPI0024DEBDE7|nr:response regulator transcription factor [Virgibacillus sp. LDC-1]
MTEQKILIVEDEAGIRDLIQLYLENRHYKVITADNGENAVELADREHPHLVVLDIEIPGIDGFEVCKRIREAIDIPILFLSGRRDLIDKIKCFELGGDDYITKPFDFAELEARIKASLQRYQQLRAQLSSEVLKYGELEINLTTYECFIKGRKIPLSTKEMQLLILLAKRPNQVFSVEQIYDLIWGIDSIGDIQTVKVHIRNLRSKIEKDSTDPKYIITVRGFGYRFVF